MGLIETDVYVNDFPVHVTHRESDSDRVALAQCLSRRDYDIPGAYLDAVAGFHRRLIGAQKNALVVDAGAHIGASALWFGYKWPPCRVVAIEPDADNFRLLQANVEAAHIDARLHRAALHTSDGEAALAHLGAGDACLQAADHQAVPTVSLATVLAESVDYVPFILKLNVAGHERALFADAAAIQAFPVVVVMLHDAAFPGTGVSAPFFRWHAAAGRDFVFQNDRAFSIDWARLHGGAASTSGAVHCEPASPPAVDAPAREKAPRRGLSTLFWRARG